MLEKTDNWYADADGRVTLLDLASGRKTELLAHSMYRLYQPHFSPDERWITFIATSVGRSRVYVVPFRGSELIPESEWLAITAGQSWEDKLEWSPDGDLLYFTSDRDGFRCIYAQRLEAAGKRPVGSMFPVFHSHSARLCLLNVELGLGEISVAPDRLVFTMGERTGNVWMAEFRRFPKL